MSLEDFEKQIVTALLAGDDPVLETLREQYAAASVRGREVTADGFTTWFDVPASAPAVEDEDTLHLDDLQVELEGGDAPVDTALEVAKGRLRSLQVSAYGGAFPSSPVIKAAWYYGTKKYAGITEELMAERDVEELLENQ